MEKAAIKLMIKPKGMGKSKSKAGFNLPEVEHSLRNQGAAAYWDQAAMGCSHIAADGDAPYWTDEACNDEYWETHQEPATQSTDGQQHPGLGTATPHPEADAIYYEGGQVNRYRHRQSQQSARSR